MAKSRPTVSSFFSTSSKAMQTQEELNEAQQKIAALEKELSEERQRLQAQVKGGRVSQMTVAIDRILRRPYRSRREKDPQVFRDLVDSIKNYGFRGSIWVQKLADGELRLIAGETRLDAAIVAGLTEIPVDIVETDDVTAVKLSRVENSRRRNLNALDDTEELLYLLMLVLGKSRSETISLLYRLKNASEGNSSIEPEIQQKVETVFSEVVPDLGIKTFVTSRLPLLSLPEDVLAAYNSGQLEYTKAIELSRVQEENLREALLQETIEQGLSLVALKSRIRPTSSRTIVDKMIKLQEQVKGINQKAIRKLSQEQRYQLVEAIRSLELLLKEKLQELETLED